MRKKRSGSFIVIVVIVMAVTVTIAKGEPSAGQSNTKDNITIGATNATKKVQKIKTVFVGAPFTDGIYYYYHGDMKKAYNKLKESCEDGVDMGCFYAGAVLDKQIIQFMEKAIRLYGRACKNGFKPACVKLEEELRRCINDTGNKTLCINSLKHLTQQDKKKKKETRKNNQKQKSIGNSLPQPSLPPPPTQMEFTARKTSKKNKGK